ncbi:3-oxo-5-alpha-steroid 4-dehydrogenase 1 isoform 1-T1 [Spinachia spinachia]
MDALLSRLFSSEEEERRTLDRMAHLLLLMAACTFVTLLFENVPYGRYATSRYGFPVNARLAWFVQELPAFLVPLCLLVWTSAGKTSLLPNRLLIAMYFCHYVHRSLIYPFLIRGGKPTPFASFALAVVFCIYNGYMQIRYLSHYAQYPADWVTRPRFIAGSLLWLLGWLVNVHSDHILRTLRKPGETGYKIPTDAALVGPMKAIRPPVIQAGCLSTCREPTSWARSPSGPASLWPAAAFTAQLLPSLPQWSSAAGLWPTTNGTWLSSRTTLNTERHWSPFFSKGSLEGSKRYRFLSIRLG